MSMNKLRTAGILLAAAFLMHGCAHPDLIDLQTPGSEVEASLGAPDARIALEDGSTRLVYSMQPMSQQVWWITLDAQGRVQSKENVLDRDHFALIKIGSTTKQDVFNLFGPCAEKFHFALKNQDAWMYRFLDEGLFYMAFWVQFDENGVVAEVGYTQDPWRDRDGDWL